MMILMTEGATHFIEISELFSIQLQTALENEAQPHVISGIK
jgi:hypothetical protein